MSLRQIISLDMIGVNNILNIRKVKQYNWLGSDGETRGFVNFTDVNACIRATCIMLMRSYRIAKADTIRKVITRFAPPSENDTEAYIKFVSEFCNKEPDAPLRTKIDYADLICAMAKMETGWKLKRAEVLDVIFCYNLRVYLKRK